MTKAVINFKIDKEVKEEVQKLAEELGLPLSSVVNAQLRELLRTRTLLISDVPKMTPAFSRIVETIERDRLQSKNVTKTKSITEAFRHLDSI